MEIDLEAEAVKLKDGIERGEKRLAEIEDEAARAIEKTRAGIERLKGALMFVEIKMASAGPAAAAPQGAQAALDDADEEAAAAALVAADPTLRDEG